MYSYSKHAAIPGTAALFSQLLDITTYFLESSPGHPGCRRHNLPPSTGRPPATPGPPPSMSPEDEPLGGATLSSQPCDMNVADRASSPAPNCSARAVPGQADADREQDGSKESGSGPGRQDAVRGVVGCVVDNGCHVVGIHLRCGIGRQERLEPPNVALRGI